MKKVLVFIFMFFMGINLVEGKTIFANSYILMDMDSNKVIYEKNAHNIRSVASISKIMTAIVAIENKNIEDKVIISEEIKKAYGSGIYIKVGEEMTLKDLLYGLMLRSGNDASLAIAKYVGGNVEEFVNMMNKKAVEIGMKNTTFNNPNGLDEEGGNLSTAYDMALLTSYAMKNEQYKEIVSTKKYTLKTNMNYYSWINKHKLLHSYKYATGGKTGFTEIAKRTLVTTASKDNINLVAVTLNDGNDFQDHIDLFEEAFENYTNYNILKKGNINILNEEYYENDTLYIENDYNITLQNKNNNVILNYKIEKKDNYNDKDIVGKIEVKINDEIVHEENIYVKKGITLSFLDKVKNWFKNLW
ncbi:MAG: D-alanyl-D-alanine carboxypeptidase [Firmicutes bacterium]|nr:D-alanyl-D-alanine carboxypeptidase [Bacillota bacterium]